MLEKVSDGQSACPVYLVAMKLPLPCCLVVRLPLFRWPPPNLKRLLQHIKCPLFLSTSPFSCLYDRKLAISLLPRMVLHCEMEWL